MHEEMNAAAAPADNEPQDLPIDRLPNEDDEFRHTIILELPCLYIDEDDDGAEKVKKTWHVISIPESYKDKYDAANQLYKVAIEAVQDEPREVKIQTLKDHQKLAVRKRGEALKPGLYLKLEDGKEQLLAKVLESGEGKLNDEMRQELDDRYFQDNSDEPENENANDNMNSENNIQEDGLEQGGETPHGITSP